MTPVVLAVTLLRVLISAYRGVLIQALENTEGLEAALVFGSILKRENPRDLDIALLWSSSLDLSTRWKRGTAVAVKLESALGIQVDAKDLRALSPPLQLRVLQEGIVVYRANAQAFVRFVSETVPQALDFMPSYEKMLRASARKLANG